jgi:hypothetical protein
MAWLSRELGILPPGVLKLGGGGEEIMLKNQFRQMTFSKSCNGRLDVG